MSRPSLYSCFIISLSLQIEVMELNIPSHKQAQARIKTAVPASDDVVRKLSSPVTILTIAGVVTAPSRIISFDLFLKSLINFPKYTFICYFLDR